MGAIPTYFMRMVLPALLGALLWILTRPSRQRRLGKLGYVPGPYREGALLILFMFLSGLLWLTLTPPDLGHFFRTGQWLFSPGVPFQGGINLIPVVESWRLFLFYLEKGMWSAILINFPGNIIMFIPIGFFAGILSDKPRWWKGTLMAFALSLFIETAQLFVARGTDVDDLILNTLGGLMGHGLFLLFRRYIPGFVEGCARNWKGSV